jgi:ELWxxDGT repeat protein
LWRYDPGAGTAQPVAGLGLPNNSIPFNLTVLDGDLYFRAYDSSHGIELWRYDPVTHATEMVADINPHGNSSNPFDLTVFDNDLYFAAADSTHGIELWRYDPGTGAQMVANIDGLGSAIEWGTTPETQLYPNWLVFNGDLYFPATDGTHGFELWRYDPGTGAQMVADIFTGSDSSHPWFLAEFNGDLYFSAYEPIYGREMWRYDPDSGATQMVADIWTGPGSGSPGGLELLDGHLYFSAIHPDPGQELWRTGSLADI